MSLYPHQCTLKSVSLNFHALYSPHGYPKAPVFNTLKIHAEWTWLITTKEERQRLKSEAGVWVPKTAVVYWQLGPGSKRKSGSTESQKWKYPTLQHKAHFFIAEYIAVLALLIVHILIATWGCYEGWWRGVPSSHPHRWQVELYPLVSSESYLC